MTSEKKEEIDFELADREKVWHHYTEFEYWRRNQIILRSGRGCELWDVKGKRYIDAISGVENVSLGQCNEAIVNAITEQASKLVYAPIYWTSSVPQANLADKLLSLLPRSFSKIFFVTGGSEANETAVKMLRQYYGYSGKQSKFKVVSRWLSYHGATLATTSMSGEPRSRTPFEPLPSGFLHIPSPLCTHSPPRAECNECGRSAAEALEQIIESEGDKTVGAFIADPIQLSSEGLIIPPKDYFPTIRAICDRWDVKLIFDEIVTGFGRTGRMFCFEHWNVVPDVLTLGKSMTGGHVPLAATVASKEISSEFESEEGEQRLFRHVFTYGGYPIGCAAAFAAIAQIERDRLWERSSRLGRTLNSALSDLGSESKIVGEVKSIGLLASVGLVRNNATNELLDPNLGVPRRVEERARKNGLIVRSYLKGVSIYPALNIGEDLLSEAIEILRKTVAEVESELL